MTSPLTKPQAEELEAVIRKAVPESRQHHDRCMNCGFGFEYCKKLKATPWGRPACIPNVSYDDRPLTLQDVLIALDFKKCHINPDYTTGYIILIMDRINTHPRAEYDLTENYHDQSDDFYVFLYSLLI